MFTSISAALETLDVTGPNRITVSGNCSETVIILSRDRLTIEGALGMTASIVASDPTRPTMSIQKSRDVVLRRLIVSGGVSGLFINDNAEVTIDQCTFENNSKTGVQASDNSNVDLDTVTIRNNGGLGLFVDDDSFAVLGEGPGAPTVLITGNGGSGILVSASTVFMPGNTMVESNAAAGLQLIVGGRALLIDGLTPNTFRGNRIGVDVQSGSAAQFSGRQLIQNNSAAGVQVSRGASVVFRASAVGAATIEGNGEVGVNVVDLGQADFSGPHKIRQNGNSTSFRRAGVQVVGNSFFGASANTEISGNIGPGVNAESGAQVTISRSSINNNSEGGLRVLRMATTALLMGTVITANTDIDLFCDSTALAFGDASGAGRVNCPRIERELGPPRPGAIIDLPDPPRP